MRKSLARVFGLVTVLSMTATLSAQQWISSVPNEPQPPVPSLRAGSYVALGPGNPPYADTTLRLSYPAGSTSPCDSYPSEVYRCFQLAFGTPAAQWFGFRLDSGNNLHLVRQGDGGWREGFTLSRGGTTTLSGYITPLHIDTEVSGAGTAEFRNCSCGDADSLELNMTANSKITVSNLQIGHLGTPIIRSNGPYPLYLNLYSPDQDVVVGDFSYSAMGFKVKSAGMSYFRGSLGVGTTTPTALLTVGDTGGTGNKFTVNGDITVAGNINAKYQDLAEWVPSTVSLQPGTVVVLDSTRPNHVVPSAREYDTTVAGVVSANPGIALGEAGDSKAPIATTGRVRVRVDASRQPIAIGDLLVTSNKPGAAMKSIPVDLQGIALHRPGTVLGKALEPLQSGEAEILVLLSLQ